MLRFNQPLGRALRLPLRAVPKGLTVPIVSGPARGLRWVVGSGPHSYWLGTHERTIAFLLRDLCQDRRVFDVGAHVGYFTLLMSRYAHSVTVFEPDSRNAAHLARNIARNAIYNTFTVNAAVSDTAGHANFASASAQGRLHATGRHLVRTVTLDNYDTPDLIKMDVEGGEVAALNGASRILNERKTDWLVEVHFRNMPECRAIFERAGYSVEMVSGDHILARP